MHAGKIDLSGVAFSAFSGSNLKEHGQGLIILRGNLDGSLWGGGGGGGGGGGEASTAPTLD